MVLGIEVAACLAAEDELDKRATLPISFVGQLEVGLGRRQHERADDKRNEQPGDALTRKAARRSSFSLRCSNYPNTRLAYGNFRMRTASMKHNGTPINETATNFRKLGMGTDRNTIFKA